jgi:hypothetical protein
MNRADIYYFTGKTLALDAVPENRDSIISQVKDREIPWEKFVSLADHHLVLQALYPKLEKHGLIEFFPCELCDHLKYIFELNTSRNQKIIEQSIELIKILESENIRPLFLKGVGNIIDDVYTFPGERILHDIDFLVHEDQFEKSAEILIDNGYLSNYEYNPLTIKRQKHYPILYKPGQPVYVEIHRIPTSPACLKHFNSEMVFSSKKASSQIKNCYVMSDEHKIIHTFLHSQIEHRGHLYARDFIRNLYDLLLLSSRSDPENVLNDFGYLRRNSSGYLNVYYSTFGIDPPGRILPWVYFNLYSLRYKLNLRYSFINRISTIFIRMFISYIKKPILSLSDKELRILLIIKLKDSKWYSKHLRGYRTIIRGKEGV